MRAHWNLGTERVNGTFTTFSSEMCTTSEPSSFLVSLLDEEWQAFPLRTYTEYHFQVTSFKLCLMWATERSSRASGTFLRFVPSLLTFQLWFSEGFTRTKITFRYISVHRDRPASWENRTYSFATVIHHIIMCKIVKFVPADPGERMQVFPSPTEAIFLPLWLGFGQGRSRGRTETFFARSPEARYIDCIFGLLL